MSCFHALFHIKWLASGKTFERKEPPECSNIRDMEPDQNGFYPIGDMMLTKHQLKKLLKPQFVAIQAIEKVEFRWPNGVVPYEFSDNVDKDRRKFIREKIRDLNNRLAGCIRIR